MEDALRVVSEFRHLLIDVHSAWLSIDRRYTVVGLSLLCATLAPELKHKSFVIHIITTFLSGFGGGMISAVLLMIVTNNGGCKAIQAHSSPRSHEHSFNLCAVLIVAASSSSYIKTLELTVDVATATYPGVHLGIIIVGTISICGGKMIVDTICHNYGILKGPHEGPHEASSPSYSFRSAFLGTLFYYFCGCCPGTLKLFSREEAAAIIITLFVVHSPSPKPQATPPPPQQQQQQQQGEKATSSQETAKVDVRNGKAAIAKNASGKGSAKSVKGSAVRITGGRDRGGSEPSGLICAAGAFRHPATWHASATMASPMGHMGVREGGGAMSPRASTPTPEKQTSPLAYRVRSPMLPFSSAAAHRNKERSACIAMAFLKGLEGSSNSPRASSSTSTLDNSAQASPLAHKAALPRSPFRFAAGLRTMKGSACMAAGGAMGWESTQGQYHSGVGGPGWPHGASVVKRGGTGGHGGGSHRGGGRRGCEVSWQVAAVPEHRTAAPQRAFQMAVDLFARLDLGLPQWKRPAERPVPVLPNPTSGRQLRLSLPRWQPAHQAERRR
eukprot:gene14202-20172_t